MRIRAIVVLLTLAAAGCARSSAGSPQELTVVPNGGVVTVISGGETTVLEEATVVDPGARILTTDGGRARVQLPDRATLELAPEAEIALPEASGPELLRGSILVRSVVPGTTVRSGETDVKASSAATVFRIDRGFSLILAVYRGAAEVLGSGVAPVPALRQATVIPGGEIQSGHRPLQVRPNDPWDAQLLGPAIDLGLELLSLERGLTRQIPRADGPRAIAQALDGFPRSAINNALEALTAARATVAAVVAQQVAQLDGNSVVRALNQIVDLQLQGAHWIVVVARWSLADASRTLLDQLARLTTAIARAVAPPPSPV
ncbi:MAG: FecR family protein, partial [Actinomycetota bacterium]|nr:FecR family protein [Actinomycetota bacterium]